MLGKVLASKEPIYGQPGMVALADVQGCSNHVQREAAKILHFPYTLARGVPPVTRPPRSALREILEIPASCRKPVIHIPPSIKVTSSTLLICL